MCRMDLAFKDCPRPRAMIIEMNKGGKIEFLSSPGSISPSALSGESSGRTTCVSRRYELKRIFTKRILDFEGTMRILWFLIR